MATNRINRDTDNREFSERPKQWMPPELLPEPDKEPGYGYKWIRVSMLNAPDPRNVSVRFREGYEPVRLEEQPKFKLLVDDNSRFKDNIEIGGLLLCKRPIEMDQQQAAYFDAQTAAQSEAVDNNLMRQSDSRMPIFMERKSSVTFGKGS
jgi:hypothetical protein